MLAAALTTRTRVSAPDKLKDVECAHLAPVAIGLTLVLNILMGGALTGAAFNPARALGPMIVTGNLSEAWLYVLAPIVGAIIAAVVHTGLSVLTHERPAAVAAAE
jgi:glycerol uptake facilitator-like aquaporin